MSREQLLSILIYVYLYLDIKSHMTTKNVNDRQYKGYF